MFVDHGQILSRSQIRYIGGFSRKWRRFAKPGSVKKSEYTLEEGDRLVDFITDGDYDYCMLSQDLDESTNKRKCNTILQCILIPISYKFP